VCNTDKGTTKARTTVSGISPDGHVTIQEYLGPESIREEVEASLRRLKTDVIDLYQTHWQDKTTPIEETMGTLLSLKEEGKIRAIGVSNASIDHMEAYRKVGQLDADQEKFSMIDRGVEREQLPYCAEHGIAALAYSPLAQGLLTGKLSPDHTFPDGDLRCEKPRFQPENLRRVGEMLNAIRPLADQRGISLSQLVIAWTARVPGLTHVLCGSVSPEHVRENAEAGDVELSDEEFRTISQRIEPQLAEVT